MMSNLVIKSSRIWQGRPLITNILLQILLRHLAEIALSKRVDDGQQLKQMHWKDYFDTILIMRRQQIERLRKQLQNQQEKQMQPRAIETVQEDPKELKKEKKSKSSKKKKSGKGKVEEKQEVKPLRTCRDHAIS